MPSIKNWQYRPSLMIQVNDPCVYCNGPSHTWDHLDARSRGGGNLTQNLARACMSCNGEKGSMTVLEYLCRRAESRQSGLAVKHLRTRDFVEQYKDQTEVETRAKRLMRLWKRKAEREAQILKERTGTKDSYKEVLSAMLNDVDFAKAQGWISADT